MVDFFICSDNLNFKQITSLLRIQPSETRSKETFKFKEFAKDYWSYLIEYEESDDICNQINQLIEVLLPRKKELIFLLDNEPGIEMGFNVVINVFDDVFPQLLLTSDVVNFFGELKCQIGFDIYTL